eukprot:5787550-Alexandrium_andersonii.AAC.1
MQCQRGRTNASAPLAGSNCSQRLARGRGSSWQDRQLPPGVSAMHRAQLEVTKASEVARAH